MLTLAMAPLSFQSCLPYKLVKIRSESAKLPKEDCNTKVLQDKNNKTSINKHCIIHLLDSSIQPFQQAFLELIDDESQH